MTQPNLSLNGVAGTLWEIRKQENIHPYLGLRQAILIINAHEKALKAGRISQKKALLSLAKQQKDSLDSNFNDLEREILLAEIELAKYELTSFDQLILDTETELKTATDEKDRILLLHPDMANASYDELQERYAKDAFHCKLARAVVISAYSCQKMISEGAAEVIYDSACLSKTDRERFEMNVVGQLQQLLPPEPVLTKNLEAINGGSNGSIVN